LCVCEGGRGGTKEARTCHGAGPESHVPAEGQHVPAEGQHVPAEGLELQDRPGLDGLHLRLQAALDGLHLRLQAALDGLHLLCDGLHLLGDGLHFRLQAALDGLHLILDLWRRWAEGGEGGGGGRRGEGERGISCSFRDQEGRTARPNEEGKGTARASHLLKECDPLWRTVLLRVDMIPKADAPTVKIVPATCRAPAPHEGAWAAPLLLACVCACGEGGKFGKVVT
jgi:hypothetical protein